MCVRCGTGRVAWCTDPYRHGESAEPVSPGDPPAVAGGSRTGTNLDPLLQEALTAALTSVVSLMPLHVTLALHTGPVLTGDGIVWSVPAGTVVFENQRVDFIPVDDGRRMD